MSYDPADLIERYLGDALAGHRQRAVSVALDLLDEGVPKSRILCEVLAPAQRETGRRWQRGELTVADEHIVSGATHSAVEALATTEAVTPAQGLVAVVCAEGEWHALPALMFVEELRDHGQGVLCLGPSVPAGDLPAVFARHQPDAVAISCSVALHYRGVTAVADAAHTHGLPVLAGGRSLTSRRAAALGADGWATDVRDAADLLDGWRQQPPSMFRDGAHLDPGAVALDDRAGQYADLAFSTLEDRLPQLASYTERQRAHTRADLEYIARYLAAAGLVGEPELFAEFIDWLADLLDHRGVPVSAVHEGLQALSTHLGDHPQAAQLAATTLAMVADAPRRGHPQPTQRQAH